MHPSNIMWYLRTLNRNSEVIVNVVRSKNIDSIVITNCKFEFSIDEYGNHYVFKNLQKSEIYNDIELWNLVKSWVKEYLNDVL